jgi:ATP-dependent DNA helicase RecG
LARVEEHPTPIRYLKGIGPRRAEALEKLGVHSLSDLLYLFPRRYEDRSRFLKIDEIRPAETATVRGEVLTLGVRPLKQMPLFEIVLGDDTGMIHAVWFNQPYLKNQFRVGMKVILSGPVEFYERRLQMNSPEYEIVESEDENPIHMGRITPIYPLTEGLYQRSLRGILSEVTEREVEKEIHDYLPVKWAGSLQLLPLQEAVREMHFPASFERLELARRRIVFDEFFLFLIELLQRVRLQRERQNGFPLEAKGEWLKEFKGALSFSLTGDQERALGEIINDLGQPFPMNRLIQGEVGSGKTVVAAFAIVLAARGGVQSAFLVPTEILAEQHAKTLAEIVRPLGVAVELLTSSVASEKRAEILEGMASGEVPAVVGTHALLQEDVRFRSLGLVVVDEQHKFGVRQRAHLLQGARRPHQLVMTATPIPRTLALTLYGDLEVSVIKELPKERMPVKTYWITREKQGEVLLHIREKVNQGEQAYLVFPTIDETEKADLFAAREEHERLSKNEFRGLEVGLVHGRLEREEREAIMKRFREGTLRVLVATSVIEVGVDNPNATMIVIENAERFGLSQLHQLRGRVGRGRKASECFLFGDPRTEEGKRRLRILTKTNDGFVIAEEDLRLRGPGELLGTRQSGEPYFKVADLDRDAETLLLARETALRILKEDLHLTSPDWERLRQELGRRQLKERSP